MKDVIFWELRRRRTAIIWWTIGSVAMTVLILALFPSIRDQAAEMNKVLNQLPQELRGLKTRGSSIVDVSDPIDFLNSQLFYATLPLIWIILAITRGAGLLGREESSKTLELLLARPISRTRLLVAKLMSFGLEFTAITGATLIAILVVAPLINVHIGVVPLATATVYTALFCLSFGLIAFAMQAASSVTRRAATATAVVIGFGGYLFASLSSMTDWLQWPVKFLPYHYFTPLDPLLGKTPRGLVIYLVAIFTVCITIAIIGFRHRDIE